MILKWLQISLFALITSSLVACGGGNDSSGSTATPATATTTPELIPSVVPITQGLTKVDAVDYSQMDQSGSWRVTTQTSISGSGPGIGGFETSIEAIVNFQQISLLGEGADNSIFALCGGLGSSRMTTFQNIVELFSVNVNDLDNDICPAGALTSRETFQFGNTLENHFSCNGVVNFINKIERVSDLANFGLGLGEVLISGNKLERSSRTCVSASIITSSTIAEPDNERKSVSASIRIPTQDSDISIDIEHFGASLLGTFTVSNNTETSAFINADGFSPDEEASSGTITITAFSNRMVELAYNLVFLDENGTTRNVSGSTQVNL